MITKYGATWRATHLAHLARSPPGAHLAHMPPGNQELPGHLAHLAGSPPGMRNAHLATGPPGASTWRKSHLAHLAVIQRSISCQDTREALVCTQMDFLRLHKRIYTRGAWRVCNPEYEIGNMDHGVWNTKCRVCRAGYGIEGSEYGLWSMELHRIRNMQGGVWNKG